MSIIRTALETREYWNNFSTAYEKFYLKTTLQVNNLLIPLLNLDPSHTVARCGCGTGAGVEILLRHYPNLTKMLANDLSESMIRISLSKNLQIQNSL